MIEHLQHFMNDVSNSLQHLVPFILHIDEYLFAFVEQYGTWTYAVLFAIIFCETGLVVTPFLPGDSLIFAAGSIAAGANHAIGFQMLFFILILASMTGNQINYFIGRAIGPRVFHDYKSAWRNKLFNKKHLERAHRFYEKHGGKTIILARFIPIIRTYAPFVAGISYMEIRLFSFYNIISAVFWISTLLAAGYYFGKLPFVQQNFSLVVYGIIVVSLLPPIIVYMYKKTIRRLCHSTSC